LGIGLPLIAEGLSGDGTTVYGTISSPTTPGMFRWDLSQSPELLTNLPADALYHIRPTAISYDGSKVVGEYLYREYDVLIPPWNDIYTVRLEQAFVYSADTQSYQSLGFLDAAAVTDDTATAYDISGDGSVVVGTSSSANGKRAFRWTAAGGMQALPHPAQNPGNYLRAVLGASADGDVAIGAVTLADGSSGPVAMWTDDHGTLLLENPDGSNVNRQGMIRVSADGATVIGDRSRPSYGRQAWRWTEATGSVYLDPNPTSPGYSGAIDVSGDGSIIVGELKRAGRVGPMIWDEQGGVRFLEDYFTEELGLDLTGWSLSKVIAISDDGQTFLGAGANPQGQPDYWLVSPGLAGDFNGDGTVDAADFIRWRHSGGSPNDYMNWQMHFGQISSVAGAGSAPTPAGSTAIPEPPCLMAAMIALAASGSKRARSRKEMLQSHACKNSPTTSSRRHRSS
jgi:probable HAF family extracellular repeat protein